MSEANKEWVGFIGRIILSYRRIRLVCYKSFCYLKILWNASFLMQEKRAWIVLLGKTTYSIVEQNKFEIEAVQGMTEAISAIDAKIIALENQLWEIKKLSIPGLIYMVEDDEDDIDFQ